MPNRFLDWPQREPWGSACWPPLWYWGPQVLALALASCWVWR